MSNTLFRIKKIEFIWWDSKLSKDQLFLWEDVKPINFFYFQNWYGKTSLFKILHYLVTSWWESKIKAIPQNLCEFTETKGTTYINKINFNVQIWEDVVLLIYERSWSKLILSSNSLQEKLFNDAIDFSNFFQSKVLNQSEYLVYINEKNEQEKRTTTVKSLSRFNFLSDQDFYKISSTECHLADTHKDGNGRRVLFNYILWEDISWFEKNIMQSVATYLKYQNDISNLTRKIKKAKEVLMINDSEWLLNNEVEEYTNTIANKLEKLKLIKIRQKEAKIAIERLLSISQNLNLFEKEYKDWYIKIINNEISYLEDFIRSSESVKLKISLSLEETDFQKLGEYEEVKNQCLERKQKEDFLSRNLYAVDIYKKEKYELSRKELYKSFKEIYKDLLSCWYKNASLNNQSLMIKLEKWDFRGDGHLRCARMLYLIALQIYKEKHPKARTLGAIFYDAPFYWVTLKYEINLLDHLVKYYKKHDLHTQLFFFDTRITSYEKDDELCEFFNKNNDIIYVHPRNKKCDKIFASNEYFT